MKFFQFFLLKKNDILYKKCLKTHSDDFLSYFNLLRSGLWFDIPAKQNITQNMISTHVDATS